MIYRINVTKAGALIFSHEIVIAPGISFAEQFKSAMDTFRSKNPDTFLHDDDVDLKLSKVANSE
ncbi:hypothetical protein [Endobacterium cereale]|uniref:hypothetical protein n=1 Tax=Endobacterium cereale TaxID=2663029 RepID=UPI002B4A0489|nr:hypothetical protein [Endobacterium cereale]MEB2843817.1 hypothetical protein [Endobacterium cereale]